MGSLTKTGLLPEPVRRRLARAMISYRRVTDMLASDKGGSVARWVAIRRLLTLWRILFEQDAGAPDDTGYPVRFYLDRVEAWLAAQDAVQGTGAGSLGERENLSGLDSDLRQIHAGVDAAIARRIQLEPGDCVSIHETRDRQPDFPWRVVERQESRALLQRDREYRVVDLGLARIRRVAGGCAEVPVQMPLDDGSALFAGPSLRYSALGTAKAAQGIATMTLRQFEEGVPLQGRVNWTLGVGAEKTVITLSNVYPSFRDIWLWCMHIASGCLPCTVVIDTEAEQVNLCASFGPDGGEDLIITHRAGPHEAPRVLAHMPRRDWLQWLGKTFGDFFAADYIPYLWDDDDRDTDRPDSLPWCDPGCMGMGLPALPHHLDRAWLWLQLAWWSHLQRDGCDYTNMMALGPHVAHCQTDALRWAYLGWLAAMDALPESLTRANLITTRDRLPPDLHKAFAEGEYAIDRFRAEWAAGDERCVLTWPDITRLLVDMNKVLQQVSEVVMRHFPTSIPGLGVVSIGGAWAEILRIDGLSLVLDWGERGIERRFAFDSWLAPRRLPQGEPVPPNTALHRRWHRFITDDRAGIFCVCPCCGYPSRETDPDEYPCENCHFCGWLPLHLGELPELDKPLELGGREYTLRQARQNFADHGDMFDLDDLSAVALLQRAPGVVAAKQAALQAWQAWLETDPGSAELPLAAWTRLEDAMHSERRARDEKDASS